MNKRLKFLIAVALIFAIFVSSFVIPASSFENNVETTTSDILLINMDTDTVVFSQDPDHIWYAGYLSELMTYLVALDMIPNPETATYKVEPTFASSLKLSDGCLKPYVGLELTAKDLMAIMLLTSGSDASFALADLAAGGDRQLFVDAMNAKAAALGCTSTNYTSPGYDTSTDHHTSCRDLYTLYMEVLKNDFYHTIMDQKSYLPPSLADETDDEKLKSYTVTPEASILNENSPYYFRYVNDAKYSYTDFTYANLVLTTTYRGKSYFFAGMIGLNASEQNIYSDARKLATWAYLNLSDRKMINSEEAMSQVLVTTDWGEYLVDLHPANSAFKTLPNDYDEAKLSYTYDIPHDSTTPLLDGQTVARAKMTYDGDDIDDVQLIVNSDEGLDLLSDFGRFSSYVLRRLMPYQPEVSLEESTESAETAPETEALTEPVTEAPASQTETAATAATEG